MSSNERPDGSWALFLAGTAVAGCDERADVVMSPDGPIDTLQKAVLAARQARWIWYPGDFETYLAQEVQEERLEWGGVTPVMWPQYHHYPLVAFSRKYDVPENETIDVWVDGKGSFEISGGERGCRGRSRGNSGGAAWREDRIGGIGPCRPRLVLRQHRRLLAEQSEARRVRQDPRRPRATGGRDDRAERAVPRHEGPGRLHSCQGPARGCGLCRRGD